MPLSNTSYIEEIGCEWQTTWRLQTGLQKKHSSIQIEFISNKN